MNKRITFRDIPHSGVMENHANDQLAKVEEFLKGERSPIYIDLVFAPSKIHAHNLVELRIKTPHYEVFSSYEGPDFYDTLDRVIDVAYRELHEKKDKLKIDDRKVVGRHEEFKKQR